MNSWILFHLYIHSYDGYVDIKHATLEQFNLLEPQLNQTILVLTFCVTMEMRPQVETHNLPNR